MKFSYSLIIFFLSLSLVSSAFSKVITQFVPSASISAEYTDNFHQTENNKDDEFSTIYGAGLSFGVIDKNASMFLNYNPQYTKYAEFSQYDSWRHDISLVGQYQATQHTSITFSENFVRDLNRTVRTNSWEKHDTNALSAGVVYQFGKRDFIGMDYTYSFDKYDTSNRDEFKSHKPSASFSYWFAPKFGFDSNFAYEKIEYDISRNDREVWSGDIRLLRSINQQLDIYISYAHQYIEEWIGERNVYYPSIGFDWQPTEDSGVSVSVGPLVSEFKYLDDFEKFHIEFDGYQNFDFTRKASLSITGSSGYDPQDNRAASLRFHIYYRLGFLFSYRLTQRMTAEFDSSYSIDQYDNPIIDREDDTLSVGAGLVWSPLKWLSLGLSWSFKDFNTDSTRDDYQENIGLFSITMSPSTPVKYTSSTPRATLENRLFER